MKRRIYLSFIGLILPSILLLSIIISLLLYNTAKNQEIAAVKDRAILVADLLNSGVSGDIRFSDYINYDPASARLSVIAPDGTVLLDSKTYADTLENHSDREEFIDAMQTGTGEALRYSQTLRAETYYYAVLLDDGNVLRMSKPVSSIAGALASSLPAVILITLLILLAANLAARRLTRGIISPLENIDFDSENAAVYDELLPFVNRIDKRKQEIAEHLAELKDRADTIEAITGNMKEGLILIDKNGFVLTANKTVREIFGEIAQMRILHVCREPDFQHAIKICLDGGNAELTLKQNGRNYSVFFSPVGGEVTGAVILFFDTTEKYRAEKQRREFSANVSHELKTPLTTISALSEMIESGMAKDGDIKDFAARISEQSGRLLSIIDDIIKLSEFDEGGIQKEHTAFDLYGLAETVADVFNGNAGNVEIRLNGEHIEITANRRMLDELLYNLIDNGIKYNRDGGHVTVGLSREDGVCKISVSDTGIGIPKKHHKRIFERFYRVDKSRSKKTGGTGLGLSIVRHIAEYHGGHVEIESTEGEGTTVTCFFNCETFY